jgi:hypothetical protein
MLMDLNKSELVSRRNGKWLDFEALTVVTGSGPVWYLLLVFASTIILDFGLCPDL